MITEVVINKCKEKDCGPKKVQDLKIDIELLEVQQEELSNLLRKYEHVIK